MFDFSSPRVQSEYTARPTPKMNPPDLIHHNSTYIGSATPNGVVAEEPLAKAVARGNVDHTMMRQDRQGSQHRCLAASALSSDGGENGGHLAHQATLDPHTASGIQETLEATADHSKPKPGLKFASTVMLQALASTPS